MNKHSLIKILGFVGLGLGLLVLRFFVFPEYFMYHIIIFSTPLLALAALIWGNKAMKNSSNLWVKLSGAVAILLGMPLLFIFMYFMGLVIGWGI